MSWNYRVVKRELDGGEVIYTINEAYYDENEDDPHTITVDPCYPMGYETLESLKKDIDRYIEALDKPVLNYDDF